MHTNNNSPARWSKSSPSWGSPLRLQRNYYAYLVTMELTGGRMVCPACDSDLDLDTAEVDRVVPALDYIPTNVLYVCRSCNQGRSALQSVGRDWTRVDAYAAAVADASSRVTVPSMKEARFWWHNRPTGDAPVSRWA